MDIPDGARAPEDRRPKAADVDEAERAAASILEELPSFVPRPHHLRALQRAEVTERLLDVVHYRDFFNSDDDAYETLELDELMLQVRERRLPWERVDEPQTDVTIEELQAAAAELDLDQTGDVETLANRIADSNYRVQLIEELRRDDAGDRMDAQSDNLKAIMRISAEFDPWIEDNLLNKATDDEKAAYISWAQGKDWQTFLALLFVYGDFAGESQSSTN